MKKSQDIELPGVEAAFLVLGAIPLVVSALGCYEDIIDPAKAFVKFQGELGRATRELRSQHTLFEQSTEVLLRPITTDQELNEMIDNTNSVLWRDPGIERRLRGSLGNAYSSYMRTVNGVQNIMIDIAAKLDDVCGVENLRRDGLGAIIGQHTAAKVKGKLQKFEISDRVKFTVKRKKIKEPLGELQRCIEMPDKFQVQVKADEIAAANELYKPNHQFRFTLPFGAIRENAKKLYNVLSKAWCSSYSSHSAGLLLEQRLIEKPRGGGAGWQRKYITVEHCDANCFGLSLLQSPTSISRKWLDVEI